MIYDTCRNRAYYIFALFMISIGAIGCSQNISSSSETDVSSKSKIDYKWDDSLKTYVPENFYHGDYKVVHSISEIPDFFTTTANENYYIHDIQIAEYDKDGNNIEAAQVLDVLREPGNDVYTNYIITGVGFNVHNRNISSLTIAFTRLDPNGRTQEYRLSEDQISNPSNQIGRGNTIDSFYESFFVDRKIPPYEDYDKIDSSNYPDIEYNFDWNNDKDYLETWSALYPYNQSSIYAVVGLGVTSGKDDMKRQLTIYQKIVYENGKYVFTNDFVKEYSYPGYTPRPIPFESSHSNINNYEAKFDFSNSNQPLIGIGLKCTGSGDLHNLKVWYGAFQ